MFGSIGSGELILIFLVVLLLFGSKRIPEVAKGMGKGIAEFKRAMQNVQEEMHVDLDPGKSLAPRPAAPPAQTATNGKAVASAPASGAAGEGPSRPSAPAGEEWTP